ncbi:MAG: hypothetical protein Q8N18_12595 [Opitutaceae bacterium]|nr:hypothetical protein [Opitutaceae bacterium]
MKTDFPTHYQDAIRFILEPSAGRERERYTSDLYVYVHAAPADRPRFAGQFYLEAFERIAGGVTFLNAWVPATPAGVERFFRWLTERKKEFVSPRPYRLGQACDGTIGSAVLHAYYVACSALGLDADRLYKRAYPERTDNPPDWHGCQHHAEWQGGVVWPDCWDAAAIDGLAESLTAINYHSLRSEFEDATGAR